jgi:hypothetical protein
MCRGVRATEDIFQACRERRKWLAGGVKSPISFIVVAASLQYIEFHSRQNGEFRLQLVICVIGMRAIRADHTHVGGRPMPSCCPQIGFNYRIHHAGEVDDHPRNLEIGRNEWLSEFLIGS